MDNIHSELIGSFIRRNNSPIEADYIFKSVDELKEFYSKPENKFILHEGLFKIVSNEEGQDLYWIHKNEDNEFEFKLLIEGNSKEDLDTVIKNLEDEIDNRIKADDDLRGDVSFDNFPENINNLLSIANLLNKINNYLKDKTEEDGSLKDHMEEIVNLIMGSPYPSDDFNSLRKIQDELTNRKDKLRRLFKDLQDEIDAIESGTGLSANGSYEPPQDSNYIKGTVSVMHAVKVLDSLIDDAINHTKLKTKPSKTIDLEVSDLITGTQIEGNVILDQEGDITERDGGLYVKTRVKLSGNNLILEVNDKEVSNVDLGIAGVLDDVIYDSDNEEIIIKFKLTTGEVKEVKLPIHRIIEEWEVDNSDPEKAVVLNRERNISGKDKLSADVRIAKISDNILEKRGNALYVPASSIKDSDIDLINDKLITIAGDLNKVQFSISDLKDDMNNTNIKIDDLEENQDKLSTIVKDLTTFIESSVSNLEKNIKDLNSKIEGVDTNLSDKITKISESLDDYVELFDDSLNETIEKLNNTSKLLDKVYSAQKDRLPYVSALISVVNEITEVVNEIAFWEEGDELLNVNDARDNLLNSLNPNGDGSPCDELDLGCPLNKYWNEEDDESDNSPTIEMDVKINNEPIFLAVHDGMLTEQPSDTPVVDLLVDWGDGVVENINNENLSRIDRPNGYYTLGISHDYKSEGNYKVTIKILDTSEIDAPTVEESWGNIIIYPKKYIKFKQVSYNQTKPETNYEINKIKLNSVKNGTLYELFANIHKPTTIEIGENVKTIETSALSIVQNEEINIPNTVKKLNARIFGNKNDYLNKVYLSNKTLSESHEDWNKIGNKEIEYTII